MLLFGLTNYMAVLFCYGWFVCFRVLVVALLLPARFLLDCYLLVDLFVMLIWFAFRAFCFVLCYFVLLDCLIACLISGFVSLVLGLGFVLGLVFACWLLVYWLCFCVVFRGFWICCLGFAWVNRFWLV